MSGTEIVVVIGGLVLGYWIVAVFLPSFWDAGRSADEAPDRADDRPQRDDGHADDMPRETVRWFEVLEIPESSSREQITAAYRRQIRQNHPDLVAQLSRELRELAEIRSREINAAYDIAMKLHRESWQA